MNNGVSNGPNQARSIQERRIEEICESMITLDVAVGYREIVRRSDGLYKNASDITRVGWRKHIVDRAIKRQQEIRAHSRASTNATRHELQASIGRLELQVRALQERCDLLTVAIKALYRTSIETGGLEAYSRFVIANDGLHAKLRAASILPTAEVHPFPKRGK